jgi:UPF0755 protein
VRKALLAFGILVTGFLFVILLVVKPDWQPRNLNEPVAFTVDRGATLSEISKNLKKKGLIKNTFLFETYGKLKKYDRKISEGKHIFETTGITSIYAELMNNGFADKQIAVTIPEGFTIEQIANELETKEIVSAKEFLSIAKTGEGLSSQLIKDIPIKKASKYRLEGYLFPDTYYFEKDSEPAIVMERMLKRLYDVIASFNGQPPLSVHEWVTLASIVEREAVLHDERAKIAGVFFNRLEENWKLQACATVLYAIGKPKERLLYEDLDIESPYNTYLNEGLPVGPIASPGKKALEAVLFPQEHEYFFYVIKGDGSGGHNFSKTYSDHQKYKEQGLREH